MKDYKKGDVITIRLDGKGPKEKVTVMSDFKAGQTGITFISLRPKVGAPYTITKSRLEKSIVETILKSDIRKIIKEEIQNVLNEDVFVLWADKVSGNLTKAIQKAKYKGKANPSWNEQYKINAKNGHGTVFFVRADNVEDAKQKITQASEKNKVTDNVYDLVHRR